MLVGVHNAEPVEGIAWSLIIVECVLNCPFSHVNVAAGENDKSQQIEIWLQLNL